MPELNRGCFGSGKMEKSRSHIVNYLYSRSTNGWENDSKRYTKKLFESAKDLYKKDLTAHFGCVNAIEFSADGSFLFSGGDDRRVLMWNVDDAMIYYTGKLGDGAKPSEMKRCHYSNIFCLAVDNEHKRVLSGSNDDQVIIHDYSTGSLVDVFLHDSPVFSLSLHPDNGNIFASAVDSGRVLIYDIRESNGDLFCAARLRTPFHGVMFNPCEPSIIATANSKLGVHLWDLRKPREVLHKCTDDACMAVRWNHSGTIVLALRNLLPVVIYDPLQPDRKLEFDAGTYFNACTMKSCSFAGNNDEYILSGSDDFNLYMWKIPDIWPESNWVGTEHLTLTGHRSIVNQVRYNAVKQLIATSGVEKIIKLWSPFSMPYSEGSHDKPTDTRHRVLCSSRSCSRSPGFLTHDYSQESVEEDTRMIHFFDNLLRNELDDVTLFPLPQTYHPDVFCLPSKRKEAKIYEKLIRKKKKRLSKVLLEKADENKSICSLSKKASGSTTRNTSPPHPPVPPPRRRRHSVAPADRNGGGGSNSSQNRMENRDEAPEADIQASVSRYSPSTTPSTTSDEDDSDANSCESYTVVGPPRPPGCFDRSKVSFKLTFSDSNDSIGSNDTKSLKNGGSHLKDSGINVSDSSDSDDGPPRPPVFSKKFFENARCIRSAFCRRRMRAGSSDSGGSVTYIKPSYAKEMGIVLDPCSSEEEGGCGNTGSDLENECSENECSENECSENECSENECSANEEPDDDVGCLERRHP